MAKNDKRSAEEKAKHEAAVEDIINHFATTYISTGNDRLSAFQDLCRDLDVEVGTGIKKCKKVSFPCSEVKNISAPSN